MTEAVKSLFEFGDFSDTNTLLDLDLVFGVFSGDFESEFFLIDDS